MIKSLVLQKSQAPALLNEEQLEILKTTVFRGLSEPEMAFAVQVCNRTGLDPFTKQIHFVKRRNQKSGKDEMAIQTGIDGFRLTAQRSGAYAGSDEPIFDDEDEPKKATVTVYKMVQGQRVPFTASARWREFYPGDAQGFMWRKMPCVMLGKCAEAQALRKAFPAELSGLYLDEEMQQADSSTTAIPTSAERVQSIIDAESHEAPPQAPELPVIEEPPFDEPADEAPVALADFVITIGQKLKGKRLKDVPPKQLAEYSRWLREEYRGKRGEEHEIFLVKVEAYLAQMEGA